MTDNLGRRVCLLVGRRVKANRKRPARDGESVLIWKVVGIIVGHTWNRHVLRGDFKDKKGVFGGG